MQTIRQFLITLRSSLWFIPGLMIFVSIVLAVVLIEIEPIVNDELLRRFPRVFGLGADGSRGMLTAIAGSMLTVAALAFSLTLSIIAQASGQYTPRILRNFMRDRVNQFILGYFVSVFAYSLIMLRTIRAEGELNFVPSLGVAVGLLLAIGGIIVLIYFIHHIASSLQVTNIIRDIKSETSEAVVKIFPECLGEGVDEEEFDEPRKIAENVSWYEVKSLLSGYIQYVDTDGLMNFAVENNLFVRMEYGIGDFVVEDTPLISITKKPKDDSDRKLNSYFNIFRYRTIEQDAGYGIRQIVDIALKALSPGVNDTTTALSCIDYLAIIVSEIAERKLPTHIRTKNDEILVFVTAPTFKDYVETAFDQIKADGAGNLAVYIRLIQALKIIAQRSRDIPRRYKVVLDQLELTKTFAEQTLKTEYEKEKFRKEYFDIKEKVKIEKRK